MPKTRKPAPKAKKPARKIRKIPTKALGTGMLGKTVGTIRKRRDFIDNL